MRGLGIDHYELSNASSFFRNVSYDIGISNPIGFIMTPVGIMNKRGANHHFKQIENPNPVSSL